jgi:lipoate-protein ligase A
MVKLHLRHYGAEKPALLTFAVCAPSVILGRGVKTVT